MRGSFTIDGYNSFERWGCVMTKGSYKELLTFPDAKNIRTNDWSECDYLETYIADAKRKAREITLNFAFVGDKSDCFGFVEYIKKDKRQITVDEFEGWYSTRLRAKSFSNFYNNDGHFRMITVRFAEDSPNLYEVHEAAEISKKYGNNILKLDGKTTNEWNAYILGDTANGTMRPNDTKQNLTIESDDISESYYFANGTKDKSKTLTFDVLMRGDTIAELFNSYSKFFSEIVNRTTLVEVERTGKNEILKGYVSSSKCTDIDILNKRIRFNITLEITAKEERKYPYLITEDGSYILTEQNEKILIV